MAPSSKGGSSHCDSSCAVARRAAELSVALSVERAAVAEKSTSNGTLPARRSGGVAGADDEVRETNTAAAAEA